MIFNISNGPILKTPVLNASYPQDKSVNVGDSVTLEVKIAEHGKPAEYTYQWYNGSTAISGATKSTYTRTASKGSHTFYCMVTNKAGSVKSRTATVIADTQWLYDKGTISAAAGSLKQVGVKYGGSAGSCTLKQNASNVTIGTYGNSGALVHFTNQIDLTNYSTLYFNGSVVDKNPNATDGNFAIGVWKSIPTSNAGTEAAAKITGLRAQQTWQINVANCSGKHYVGIACHGLGTADNPYTLATMNQMWLK